MMKLWMAPHGLHVEPGIVGDADALARLHAEGFYRGWPRDEFAAYLSGADTPALVACDAGRRIAGFAMLRLVADEAELLTIAVGRKWRGKGIGGALMGALIEELGFSYPVRRLFLEVEEGNEAALRLYRRFGFIDLSRREGYYRKPDGSAAAALVMRRELG